MACCLRHKEEKAVDFVCESNRDQRTLQWLIAQVGEAEVASALQRLAGMRRAYPRNIAKVLDLSPPRSLACPPPSEVQANFEAILRFPRAREQ